MYSSGISVFASWSISSSLLVQVVTHSSMRIIKAPLKLNFEFVIMWESSFYVDSIRVFQVSVCWRFVIEIIKKIIYYYFHTSMVRGRGASFEACHFPCFRQIRDNYRLVLWFSLWTMYTSNQEEEEVKYGSINVLYLKLLLCLEGTSTQKWFDLIEREKKKLFSMWFTRKLLKMYNNGISHQPIDQNQFIAGGGMPLG